MNLRKDHYHTKNYPREPLCIGFLSPYATLLRGVFVYVWANRRLLTVRLEADVFLTLYLNMNFARTKVFAFTSTNFQQWMSRLAHRWRTLRTAIRNANCRIQWVIEILNAYCTFGLCLEVCLYQCPYHKLALFFLGKVQMLRCLFGSKDLKRPLKSRRYKTFRTHALRLYMLISAIFLFCDWDVVLVAFHVGSIKYAVFICGMFCFGLTH